MKGLGLLAGLLLLGTCLSGTRAEDDGVGLNPHPVVLRRPAAQGLSALALIGRRIFHDPRLSASGRQSCASCHSPAHAFGPPDGRLMPRGGIRMSVEGTRAVPSLAYLYRQEAFAIGPAGSDDVPVALDVLAQQAQGQARSTKSAGVAPAANALVPSGGLFWDGRADSLMDQAMGPMMNPAEMANANVADAAARLVRAGYPAMLRSLFGDGLATNPELLFAEAMSAVSRYQIEDRAFHRFDSRYDHWLEGKARLTAAQMRGLRLFNDPAKGNCAACHISAPGQDGAPPLFTDTEYEALAVPRNRHLGANRNPHHMDLGLCGPVRADLAGQTQYCGMFLTPTLRNAARRGVYFHNGVYHTLRKVLDFYNLRDTDPARIYPRDGKGRLMVHDDLPMRYRANIDMTDAPFGRKQGQAHPLSERDIEDIIAFIGTLEDGDVPA
ncbi:cytochrome-c peroxidase [Novosphingobium terrae]|uniref:cytochrome-c peroxidase n=1 Tax=Novosphingobium terrae TaxID=2726189 RepID=UPI00197CE8AE|nr:cytochrome c peroxidase [Novosphingobium terrae]